MKQTITLLSLLTSVSIVTGLSGTTTRYWDCCKPSCAWPGKGQTSGIVGSCDKNDKPLTDNNAKSGCESGGVAYMCSSQSPWAVSDDLAYGFAAVTEANPSCCQCYQLTFTSGVIKGKKMIVQATNTGNDVNGAQFDLAMPGGGFGQFDGCSNEWGATDAVWGQRYGGPTTNTCPQFPTALQSGCGFRWDWMQGADNPTVDYEKVACPAEIVAKSGCGSSDGATSPAAAATTSTETAGTTTPTTTEVAANAGATAGVEASATTDTGATANAGSNANADANTNAGATASTGDKTPPSTGTTTDTEASTSGGDDDNESPDDTIPSSPSSPSSAPSASASASPIKGKHGKKGKGGKKWQGKGTMGRYRYHQRPSSGTEAAAGEKASEKASPAEGQTSPSTAEGNGAASPAEAGGSEGGKGEAAAAEGCDVQYVKI